MGFLPRLGSNKKTQSIEQITSAIKTNAARKVETPNTGGIRSHFSNENDYVGYALSAREHLTELRELTAVLAKSLPVGLSRFKAEDVRVDIYKTNNSEYIDQIIAGNLENFDITDFKTKLKFIKPNAGYTKTPKFTPKESVQIAGSSVPETKPFDNDNKDPLAEEEPEANANFTYTTPTAKDGETVSESGQAEGQEANASFHHTPSSGNSADTVKPVSDNAGAVVVETEIEDDDLDDDFSDSDFDEEDILPPEDDSLEPSVPVAPSDNVSPTTPSGNTPTSVDTNPASVPETPAPSDTTPASSSQTDETEPQSRFGVNREFDERIIQGGTGDCFLIASSFSLASSTIGAEILKNSIQINDNSITVHFRGIGESYEISKEEIEQHDTDNKPDDDYSNGDNDMLVLELAVEKLWQDINSGKVRLNTVNNMLKDVNEGRGIKEGGHAKQMIYYLTGIIAEDCYNLNNKHVDDIPECKVQEMLQKALSMGDNACMNFALYGDIDHIATLKDGSTYSVNVHNVGHNFSITKVTADSVKFVNPWNTAEEFEMSWEDFASLGVGYITLADLSEAKFAE